MHMADALISPAVGGSMWAVSAGLIAYCARRLRQTMDERLLPMMGVLGAFIFAAQMINFSIPGTGSSGHLGGGLILAIILGPDAALLVIASVLTLQALFFADGGLLALGCNIFNLGFFPAFVAYPLVYRRLAGRTYGSSRAWFAAVIAAVVGLQLGAFSVVAETTLSGISELPFKTFMLLMLPIHLAIGVVEGLATAAVVAFVARARPGSLDLAMPASATDQPGRAGLRNVVIGLAVTAVVVGGALSWFASSHPDGLEWSVARVTGTADVSYAARGLHQRLARVQERTAFLPDYGFKAGDPGAEPAEPAGAEPAGETERWPAVSGGTSVAGIAGALITLGLVGAIGYGLMSRRRAG
jgi:cobalt/nickel transport system permease protein